jgi:hypothetical protein
MPRSRKRVSIEREIEKKTFVAIDGHHVKVVDQYIYSPIRLLGIHLENGIYLISAVTEKGLNLEEKAEAEAKAGSSKTRSSAETPGVPATNLAKPPCPGDDSDEDISESREECEYLALLQGTFRCVQQSFH